MKHLELHLMVIVMLLTVCHHSVQCFSPPSASFFQNILGRKGRSPPFQTVIAPNQGSNEELQVAAKFFTYSFWTTINSTGTGTGRDKDQLLTENQFRLLFSSQVSEFRKRYGKRTRFITNSIGTEAKLLMSTNAEKGEPCGCVGIQVSEVDCPEQGCKIQVPVMSDLAIDGKFRRMGLAEDLIQAAENVAASEWGYNECYLFVDEKNTPALRLYKKLGYRVVDEKKDSQILRPNATGGIGRVSTIILCMRKVIRVRTQRRKREWW